MYQLSRKFEVNNSSLPLTASSKVICWVSLNSSLIVLWNITELNWVELKGCSVKKIKIRKDPEEKDPNKTVDSVICRQKMERHVEEFWLNWIQYVELSEPTITDVWGIPCRKSLHDGTDEKNACKLKDVSTLVWIKPQNVISLILLLLSNFNIQPPNVHLRDSY